MVSVLSTAISEEAISPCTPGMLQSECHTVSGGAAHYICDTSKHTLTPPSTSSLVRPTTVAVCECVGSKVRAVPVQTSKGVKQSIYSVNCGCCMAEQGHQTPQLLLRAELLLRTWLVPHVRLHVQDHHLSAHIFMRRVGAAADASVQHQELAACTPQA